MYKKSKSISKKVKRGLAPLIIKLIDTQKKVRPTNKKVLVNDCQKLGNYVFKTPLIRGLAQNGYEVYVMASKMTEELAEANPHIKGIVKDGSYKKKSINIFKNCLLGIRNRGKYHLYIESTGNKNLREVLFIRLLNAEKTIACKREGDLSLKLVDYEIEQEGHARLTPLNALKVLDIETENHYDEIRLDEDKYKEKELKKPLVLFNWKGSKARTTLKLEERRRIIDNLKTIKEIDFQEIKREKTTSDLCSLIKRASMIITVDTGILHLASAYNIPTVAHSHTGHYYLPTSTKQWIMDITSDSLIDVVSSNF